MDNIEKVDSEIKNLEININNLEKKIKSLLVNDIEMDNLYYEIRKYVRESLGKIFGDQDDIKRTGFIENVFDYSDSENYFKDTVLFSHWTFRGLSHQYFDKFENKADDFRVNPFYKGNRWSSEDRKEAFYIFFKKIKEACENDVPIDFFSIWGIVKKIRHIYISTNDNKLDCSIDFNNPTASIKLPILNDGYNQIQSTKFIHLLEFIHEMKNNISTRHQATCYFDGNKYRIDNLTTEVKIAFDEFCQKDLNLLNSWSEAFKTIDSYINPKKVFNVIISYQYYDIPYDIHMFLPDLEQIKRPIKKSPIPLHVPLSCFAISLKPGKMIYDFEDSFKRLSNVLEKSCIIDKLIWDKHAENILIYNKWQEIYNLIQEKYYRLALLIESICYSVCKNVLNSEHINYIISTRIKNPLSLYNKITNKINLETVSNKRKYIKKLNLLLTSQDHKQSIDVAHEIIKELKIKDIAGLRIICKYDEDTEKINREFIDVVLKENKDLRKIDTRISVPFDINNIDSYRSIHLWVSLGTLREKLYGVEDIYNLIAEIQIRSTLAQGWADVAHEVYYKPKLPKEIKDNHRNEIKHNLKTESIKLDQIDQAFNNLRNEYKKKFYEFKIESKKGKL